MKIDPAVVVEALQNDHTFAFKNTSADYFTEGRCPDCGKKEVSISKREPWRLFCNRLNKCGYEDTTRNLYPELWASLTKIAPPTESDPNATARYYLKNQRGFNTAKIAGWYRQSVRTIKALNGETINVDVIRFPLGGDHYQDRLLNQKDIDRVDPKKKAPFSYGYKYAGKAWLHPGFELQDGDTCFLVEGIFHAIALLEVGHKAIASFSSNNYPREVIEANKHKNITWVLGYDDDTAGHNAINKFKKSLKTAGQKYRIALTGSFKDWDDLLKEKQLDDSFIDDCLWRGDLFDSKNVAEKAYHLFLKNNKSNFITDFANRTYQCVLDKDKLEESLFNILEGEGEEVKDQQDFAVKGREVLLTDNGFRVFTHHLKVWSIAQCNPIFLYSETDKITHEITYYFEVFTPSLAPKQVPFSGAAIESSSSFNKALLSKVTGATFEGDAKQLKAVREAWFAKGIDEIQTVPFIGYDKESKIYLFPKFAFKNGRKIKVNKYNYVKDGQHRLKTTFKSFDLVEGQPFNAKWFNDFHKTFDQNGIVVLAYWLGSLFAEQIRAKHASFPFLEMCGMPGTGKSTLLTFLWKCCGRDNYEGFDAAKATFSARSRNFTQVANLPVVLIESDRDKDSKKGGLDFNEFKNFYNGGTIRSMGAFNRGNEVVEPLFRTALIFAQNAEIDAEPAMIERIVNLEFTKAHFSPATEKLSRKIETIPCEEVSGFLEEALSHEKEIMQTFFELFDSYKRRYTDNGILKNSRIIKCHSQLAALVNCLPKLFPQMNQALIDETTDFIEQRGELREKRRVSDHPIVEQFWETYDLLDDDENRVMNHSSREGLIAVHLPDFMRDCAVLRYEMPNQQVLKPLLKTSEKRKFIGYKPVWSKYREKTMKCWVFEQET